MMKKFDPAGALHVPCTVCVPGPAAVAGGMLICVLNDVIDAALYWMLLAYSMFIFTAGVVAAEPGLMKCMFNMICVPAGSGSPTPSGIFISMIWPAVDVA